MSYIEMTAMTWVDAEELGEQDRVLGLLPVAALEQHGPHLPLATDMLIAEELARMVADQIVEPVLVAPVFPGGLSGHHLGFPGTVTLESDTFEALLTAYVEAFERIGIPDVVIFSTHGGNFGILQEWVDKWSTQNRAPRVIVFSDLIRFLEVAFEGARRGGLEPCPTDTHAGGIETSQIMASSPDLVRPLDGVRGYVGTDREAVRKRFRAEGLKSVSATGVLGDVAEATPGVGQAVYQALADYLLAGITTRLGLHRIRDTQ